MTWWEITVDTMMTGLKVGSALLGTFLGMCILTQIGYTFKDYVFPYVRKKVRKKLLKWYREERRYEHQHRVENAKAIEEWCRKDYYGDL